MIVVILRLEERGGANVNVGWYGKVTGGAAGKRFELPLRALEQ